MRPPRATFTLRFKSIPTPNTKYNEGLAWGKAGKDAPEADALAEALSYGGLDDTITETATARLQQLKIRLGQVVVTKPLGAKISVAHASERSVPASVHLQPGAHELRIEHRDGSMDSRKITVVAAEETQVAFDAPDRRVPVTRPPRSTSLDQSVA